MHRFFRLLKKKEKKRYQQLTQKILQRNCLPAKMTNDNDNEICKKYFTYGL